MAMQTHVPRDPREYWRKVIADMRQTNQILKDEQEQTKRHLTALNIINRTSRTHIQEMQQEQKDLMSKLAEVLAAAAPSDSRLPSTKLSTKFNKVPFAVHNFRRRLQALISLKGQALVKGLRMKCLCCHQGICQRRSWHSLSQGTFPRPLMPTQ